MGFASAMDNVARAFEALGVFVLAVGTLLSLMRAAAVWRQSKQLKATNAFVRESLGGTLLLGLEILVAADLVRTIAVAPTLENVATLGLIVLIRTFLSFSLEIEIDGTLPWRRNSRNLE